MLTLNHSAHKCLELNLLNAEVHKALALKKTNFVSRNIGRSNKFSLLPLCQPCIQFCLELV